MNNILITGASGFVGQSVVQSLSKLNKSIFIFSRNKEKSQKISWPKGVTILTKEDVAHYPYDALINLAGAGILDWPWTKKRVQELYNSRIDYSKQLFSLLQSKDKLPNLLINASAVGYYGFQGEKLLVESDKPCQSVASDLCQKWEEAAFNSGCEQVSCLRFGVILGREGGALKRMLTPFKLGLGGPIGSGMQWMSWIHIHDVLRIIEDCLEGKIKAPLINATAPNPLRQHEFANILSHVLRRPCFLTTPNFVLRAIFKEGSKLLTESSRVTSQVLEEQGFEFHFPKCDQALEDLVGQQPSIKIKKS